LLNSQSGNTDEEHEWHALLEWLEMMFPEGTYHSETEQSETDVTESDLLNVTMQRKAESGRQYAEKLLDALMKSNGLDKQMLALNQLAYMNHPEIDITVKKWLASEGVHPVVQFKALQMLKKRGVTGLIEITKWNETVLLDIEETPANMDEFPAQIHEIVLRVQEISEINQPMLAYFAQETWQEFLAFIYGTSIYRQILKQDQDIVDVWASALHVALQETVFQDAAKEEVLDMYGITRQLAFSWEQAYRIMKQYMRTIGFANA
jgi:hypothetical protein